MLITCINKTNDNNLSKWHMLTHSFSFFRPRLGTTFHKVVGVGALFFIFASIEGCLRQLKVGLYLYNLVLSLNSWLQYSHIIQVLAQLVHHSYYITHFYHIIHTLLPLLTHHNKSYQSYHITHNPATILTTPITSHTHCYHSYQITGTILPFLSHYTHPYHSYHIMHTIQPLLPHHTQSYQPYHITLFTFITFSM